MIKRFLTATLALSLVFALGLGVTACIKKNAVGENVIKNVSATDVYALSALSGAGVLGELDKGKTASVNALLADNEEKENAEPLARPSDITDETLEETKTNIAAFKNVISSGGLTSTIKENDIAEGEKSAYKFVMSIKVGDNEALLYYNETSVKAETETDEDGEEEREETATLEGLLVIGEKEYLVTGEKEVETEEGEKEESLTVTTKSKLNPLNYVKFSTSAETEENEKEVTYKYEVYENGKKVQKTKISFEEEDGKLEVKFENEQKTDATKTQYKLIYENGKYRVKYLLNGKKRFFTVVEEETGLKIIYDNGFEEVI